ncbi:MAG: Rrf2 family transcriptional regulator, partial [Rhodospirillales bacterium]
RPIQLSNSPTSRLTTAVAVLACLFAKARDGGGVSYRELIRAARVSLSVLEPLLEDLRGQGYVERTSGNVWVLSRDLRVATLYDLYRDLGLGVNDADDTLSGGGWQAALAAQLDGLRGRNAEAMALPVADILVSGEDGGDGKGAASLKSVS